MSSRGGGSRYRDDDERAGRFAGERGGNAWQDDEDLDDRWSAPPPRRQGSSRASSRAAQPQRGYGQDDDRDDDHRVPRSRSSRANAWDDDDRWSDARGGYAEDSGWNGGAGPSDWNDPRYAGDRRGGAALGMGAASRSRSAGRDGEAERRLPIRGILVALVSVVVLAGLGFGAYTLLKAPAATSHPTTAVADAPFATYTPGATPTPAPNFKEFASARAQYIINYQTTWAVSSNEGKLQQQYDYTDVFNPPNSPSHVSVEQASVFAFYTDQKIIQGEVTGAQQNGYTFTEVPTAQTTQTVGGSIWQRREYDINANGQPFHMAILATHHAGKGYVIVLVSSAAEFGNDSQAVFEPMLASFRFSA